MSTLNINAVSTPNINACEYTQYNAGKCTQYNARYLCYSTNSVHYAVCITKRHREFFVLLSCCIRTTFVNFHNLCLIIYSYTLNSITSPSCTIYSFPSMRTAPLSRAEAYDPALSNSCQLITSQHINLSLKSE